MPRVWAPAKGRDDFDNLAKSTCDALTGILWEDDGQVVHVVALKMYAAGDEGPGVEVMVEEIDGSYWQSLRERLERELSQDEIVIRAQEIRRL